MDIEKIKEFETIEQLFLGGKTDKDIASTMNKKLNWVTKARTIIGLKRSFRVNMFVESRPARNSPFGIICPQFTIPKDNCKEIGIDIKGKYNIKAKPYGKKQILLTITN